MTRRAVISSNQVDAIKRYLPSNYHVVEAACTDTETVIEGEDSHGWTLDDYVLPRLASGLYFGTEVSEVAANPVFCGDNLHPHAKHEYYSYEHAVDCMCPGYGKTEPFPLLDYILEFEEGDISEERLVELFQHLVDTGQAWTLQGVYGRTAMSLIEAGLVTR